VFSGEGKREAEARKSAGLFAGEQLASFSLHAFRDGFFPDSFADIKEEFRALQQTVDPDLIFTHWRHDLHQDHRLIAELTGQAFRDHLTLEYEILKYDGDLGNPNLYVPVERADADRKVGYLLEAFESQHDKYWFGEETFRALMRIRGVECRSSSGYAEAFYNHKSVLGGMGETSRGERLNSAVGGQEAPQGEQIEHEPFPLTSPTDHRLNPGFQGANDSPEWGGVSHQGFQSGDRVVAPGGGRSQPGLE